MDNNVTRNLNRELEDMSSWDVMILHYLGIDHIGHTQGPRGSLMGPKQGEYDIILDRIYRTAQAHDAAHNTSTLLVVAGDHGMSATGNHGGSSRGERSTGLVFLSPSRPLAAPRSAATAFNATVRQVDVCPTLASLLGLPTPPHSAGAAITDVVCAGETSRTVRTRTLYRSVCQLKAAADALGVRRSLLRKGYEAAVTAYAEYTKDNSNASVNADAAEAAMEAFIQQAAAGLSSRWAGIDWYRTFAGLCLVALTVLGAVFALLALFSSEHLTARLAPVREVVTTVVVVFLATSSGHILVCLSGDNMTRMGTCAADTPNKAKVALFCVAAGLALIPLYGTRFLRTFVMKVQSTGGANSMEALLGLAGAKGETAVQYIAPPVPEWVDTVLCFLLTAAHCVSYFSSSLIEEEQQTLYYTVTTATFIHLGFTLFWNPQQQQQYPNSGKKPRRTIAKLVAMLVMLRVIRAWNSTGARGTPFHGDIAELLSDETAYGPVASKVFCAVAVATLAWYTHRVLGYDNKVYLRRGRHIFETLTFLAYALVFAYKFPLLQYVPFMSEVLCARMVFALVFLAFIVGMFWPCVPGTTVKHTNTHTHTHTHT